MNYLERNRNVIFMVRGNKYSFPKDDELTTMSDIIKTVNPRTDTKYKKPWVTKVDENNDNYTLYIDLYDSEREGFDMQTEGMFIVARQAARKLRRFHRKDHEQVVETINDLMGKECAQHIDSLKENLYYLSK